MINISLLQGTTMYRQRSVLRKTDGTSILPFLAELDLNGGKMFQFRSSQPGFIKMSKEVSEDKMTLIVISDWESEAAYNDCIYAESSDALQATRIAGFETFIQTNGIVIEREYTTV